MRLFIIVALVALLFAACTAQPVPTALSKERANAVELLELKFQRDTAEMQKLTAQVNQYRAEFEEIRKAACVEAKFKVEDCIIDNKMVKAKPPAPPQPAAEAAPQKGK